MSEPSGILLMTFLDMFVCSGNTDPVTDDLTGKNVNNSWTCPWITEVVQRQPTPVASGKNPYTVSGYVHGRG
jgi:hypothetical protein